MIPQRKTHRGHLNGSIGEGASNPPRTAPMSGQPATASVVGRRPFPAASQGDVLTRVTAEGATISGSRDVKEVRVELSPRQREEARQYAERTFEEHKNNPNAHYRNTFQSHFVGRLGEVAVSTLLKTRLPVEDCFADPARFREADLAVKRTRIEVKTWSAHSWEKLGRCISESQLPYVEKKADVVVWASVDTDSGVVTVHGWNQVDEFREIPAVPTGREGSQIVNHQMPQGQVHPIRDLRDDLMGRADAA